MRAARNSRVSFASRSRVARAASSKAVGRARERAGVARQLFQPIGVRVVGHSAGAPRRASWNTPSSSALGRAGAAQRALERVEQRLGARRSDPRDPWPARAARLRRARARPSPCAHRSRARPGVADKCCAITSIAESPLNGGAAGQRLVDQRAHLIHVAARVEVEARAPARARSPWPCRTPAAGPVMAARQLATRVSRRSAPASTSTPVWLARAPRPRSGAPRTRSRPSRRRARARACAAQTGRASTPAKIGRASLMCRLPVRLMRCASVWPAR